MFGHFRVSMILSIFEPYPHGESRAGMAFVLTVFKSHKKSTVNTPNTLKLISPTFDMVYHTLRQTFPNGRLVASVGMTAGAPTTHGGGPSNVREVPRHESHDATTDNRTHMQLRSSYEIEIQCRMAHMSRVGFHCI